MAEDFSAVTKQMIADRQVRQKELEAQKELLSKMSTELETAGMKAEDNAEYNKKSLELDKQQLKFRLNGADSPSARKEIKAEQAAAAKKNQGLLGKIAGGVTGMFGKMGEKVKGAGKGIMAMLKGTLLAGLMIALLAFLESDTWKKMKENLEAFLDNPSFLSFFKIFEPVGKWSIIAAIGGLALLFAPIRTTMMVGGLLFKGIKGLVGMFGKKGFLTKGINRLTGMGSKASAAAKAAARTPVAGTQLAKNLMQKAGTQQPPVAQAAAKAKGGMPKSLKAVGKGLLKGARFLGPIGLAVAAAVTLYDGITAGMDEYEKTGDLAKSIKTGAAASLSSLTFGLVSTETFKGAFDWIGDKTIALTTGVKDMAVKAWAGVKDLIPTQEQLTTAYTGLKDKVAGITTSVTTAATAAYTTVKDLIPTQEQLTTAYTGLKDYAAGITTSVTDAASKAWTSVKDLIPSEATLKEKFTTLKADLAPLLEIKLPTEFSFSAIQTSVTSMANGLYDSFANITGIDVSATLTGI